MNSDNVVKNLRALWRTDRIIAELRMRHMLVGLGLRAFAALIAAFGLLMLELAAYFALVQIWSAISAAAILGLVNFVIAAVLFVIAGRPPAGRELELANEIHGSAVDALQTEARGMQQQFSGMVQHPLNSALPLILVPLITIIVRSLKKSKTSTTARSAATTPEQT
ncbi:MAG: phage holin family protein [Rhizobiales bacterium]|nr:phage holin family protein [Hyphomicrobiales bacterium]